MFRSLAALLALTLLLPGVAAAQLFESGDSGARDLLPRADEIALARSAAPAAVSEAASVYVLTANGYELAAEGTSGIACYVSRAWLISLEPHCFDPEGTATVMKIHMRRVELLHAGVEVEAAGATVMGELLRGEHRLPRRPAMSWMQSSAQQLVAPNGQPVGAWKPHVMIYYPFLSAGELGFGGESTTPASAMISDGGTPLSTLVVVVPDFVDPVVTAAGTP
ncbi:MAG: hypothetical protein ACODAA_02580 [Gemmatimonadota bacterium]